MKTLGAVLVECGQPLELAELEIPALKEGQVLVEVAYSGICHTQILECRGYRGNDPYLPHTLGHEASGFVLETGPGVNRVKSGQPVVLSWIKGAGRNVPGTVYRWGDRTVNAGAITTFSRQSVVSENRLTALPDGFPMREAALLGCAIPTGVGAVVNTGRARSGKSLVVFGVGGVGLCAVAGAAWAECEPIVAVDLSPRKLELARAMGATHTVPGGEEDTLERIRAICPAGVDIAIEVTGRPPVMEEALQCVRPRGGTAVVVGNARHGERLTIDPGELNQGKRLLGTWGGDSQPDTDFPRYRELISNKNLNLEPLVSNLYSLEEINSALGDLESGRAVRPLVQMLEG